jgi:hypothetical protein
VNKYNLGVVLLILISSSLLAWGGGKVGHHPADHKTPVCHTGPDGYMHTLCVNNSGLNSFIEHGDTIGPCENDVYFRSCALDNGNNQMCWEQ